MGDPVIGKLEPRDYNFGCWRLAGISQSISIKESMGYRKVTLTAWYEFNEVLGVAEVLEGSAH